MSSSRPSEHPPKSAKTLPVSSFPLAFPPVQASKPEDLEDGEIGEDGLGTIRKAKLPVDNALKKAKKDAKRKKKAMQQQQVLIRSKEWTREWEEIESVLQCNDVLRDPDLNSRERIRRANAVFNNPKQRFWPHESTGVRKLYDLFQVYTGLLVNKNQIGGHESDSDDDEDDPDEENFYETNTMTPQAGAVETDPSRGVIPDSVHNKNLIQDEVDAEKNAQRLTTPHKSARADKLSIFLNDPEKSIQIFLSSQVKKFGVIWSDKNLVMMPHIVYFFVKFLIVNRVLREPEQRSSLQRALQLVELARKELPLTSKMAKALPDEFNLACKECWGIQGNSGYEIFHPDAAAIDKDTRNDSGEPENKRPKLEHGTLKATVTEEPLSVVDKADNTQLIAINDITMVDLAKDVIEDIFPSGFAADSFASGWGNDGSTWGAAVTTAPPLTSGWGNGEGTWGGVIDDEAGNVRADPWGNGSSEWVLPEPPSLTQVLGPDTTLPLTHAPGIVEWSVRRIKQIIPPTRVAAKSAIPADPDAKANPELVEAELVARFTRVVLTPWTDWEDCKEEPGQSAPRILPSSRGPVVDAKDADGPEAGKDIAKPLGTRTPHDPFKDDITIFVGESVLDTLGLGMGLGGTWVQLARQKEDLGDDVDVEKVKSSEKNALSKNGERFWYMEDLVLTSTSYHLV